MELEREPNPKPQPEATGSIGEQKKMQVISAVAIGFGLIMTMLLAWAWTVIHRPAERTRTFGPTRAESRLQPKTPTLNEDAEKAYEEGRRAGTKSNPAFNLNTGTSSGGTGQARSETVEKKPTPKDEYDDLLAKAALADSAVAGTKRVSSVAAALSGLQSSPAGRLTRREQSSPEESKPAESKLQPIGGNTLPAGTFIDCSLVNELDGENVGPVKFQVSGDVYYPNTFDIAIPQGSVFLGDAQRVSAQFQQRLAVSFDRLQLVRRDKLYEVKLRAPALDQQGATALKDKVNNHYLQIFGSALAIGAIGGLAQIGNGSYGGLAGYDASTQLRNGISQTMAENASQVLNKFLMRMPTITIRPGKPALIYLPFGLDLS